MSTPIRLRPTYPCGPPGILTDLIKETGEFVINLTTAPMIRAAEDYCGVKSGRDVDKFEAMNLAVVPATQVSCPMLLQSPLSLECRVTDVVPMGSHDMFLADIVAVNVDPKYVDETGRAPAGTELPGGVCPRADTTSWGKKLGALGFRCAKNARKTRTTSPETKNNKNGTLWKGRMFFVFIW